MGWASPTTEAGSPTCSSPRTGTSARCSTFSSGQEVDSGTSLGSLSAASLCSCLLETQSLYIWGPALGGHQPYNVTDLSISGQGYICTGIYVAIYISMCFLKLQFEIHWYLQKKK